MQQSYVAYCILNGPDIEGHSIMQRKKEGLRSGFWIEPREKSFLKANTARNEVWKFIQGGLVTFEKENGV